MSIPERYGALLPRVRETLLRGGLGEGVVNAIFVGIIVGASWGKGELASMPDVFGDDRAVDELAKDILAAYAVPKPTPTPFRNPS